MDYRPYHNGHSPFVGTALAEPADVAASQNVIIAQEVMELFEDEHGRKFRRVRTLRRVARRTFIAGRLKGKYWGYSADKKNQQKGIGDFFDITIYESEIFVDKCDIKTDGETNYKELVAELSRKHSCQTQQIHFEQFSENILVVRDHESSQRYRTDIHEPRLFNPKLLHGMHQSNGDEVFGTIESPICGYLVDSVVKAEETVEEIFERRAFVEPETIVESTEIGARETIEGPLKPPIAPIHPEKQWVLRNKESILLLLLLALALLFLLIKLPLIAILLAVGLLLLLFRIPTWRSRLPLWALAVFALLFGLLLWDSFKVHMPVNSGSTNIFPVERRRATGEGNGSSGQQGAADPIKPSADSPVNPDPRIVDVENNGPRSQTPPTPRDIAPAAAENSPEKSAHNPEAAAPPASKGQATSFEQYLSRGLKAVEDEEYELANQNFRQAARISPGDLRLRELAASYKAMADQKCEQFTQSNAKHLSYIPNNYYEYAASLTQTVPLKCD